MTIETADMKFLSRAMGAPVPFGADPEKWTRAALLNGEKRAAGVATIEALLYQLPTPEDAARTPVEAEMPKRIAYAAPGAADLCPCESTLLFSDCHGLAPAE